MPGRQHPQTAATSRGLFGGAITASVAESFLDVSHIREIPDNQEVFVDVETDQSIVVELLESPEGVAAEDAAKYHFEQLAADNDSGEATILSVEQLEVASATPYLPPTTQASILVGRQQINKFNERTPSAVNTVVIYLAVIRLPQVGTDVLVSYNHPIALGEGSSSAAALSEAGGHIGVPDVAAENFKRSVQSLNVIDWGLFGV
ncbi:Mog1 protein [Fimicolochytrium jonesii]|uniref:Mog1 protein n=1 Tax=Fimicolochytrium jonesii TaxID=1396493 RepID=UPI0022FE49F8|nr:Mog1 protein [Fimicolochytrium jonesii]KAI8822245.1 Mog1 protein [Fimicolochytrium jonesii]